MASTTSPFSILTSQNPNSSVANDTEKQLFILKQPTYMIAIYSVAYSVVFLCALFGNLMVVTVVFRNRAMRTVTNCFIVNLAVADILVAVFNLPITLLSNLYLGKYVKQVVKFSVYKRKICVPLPTMNILFCTTQSYRLYNLPLYCFFIFDAFLSGNLSMHRLQYFAIFVMFTNQR